MDEIIIDVSVKGQRPLLQNAFLEESNVSKKGHVYVDEEEANKRLIKDKDGIICQPGIHFEASMIKSATEFKFSGRKTYKDLFKAGVFVDPLYIPHRIQTFEIDKQPVVINKARIMRCRPRFDDWELEFKIQIRDDRIEGLIVKEVLENAGKYHGIGDYRPRYGLFEVTKFNILSSGKAG